MSKKTINGMIRQGDVLIINKNCMSLRKATRERLFGNITGKPFDFNKEGRLPLAYGEASDHCHEVSDQNAELLVTSNDVQETLKHLRATKDTVARHEEHSALQVPSKAMDITMDDLNAVLIQCQWKLNEVQRAAD